MTLSNPSPSHPGLELVLAPLIQDFMRFMQQQGLSSHQIHILMFIYHAGQCQVSDVGVLTGASKAAASQAVDRLVQQGLVEREEDPQNRRTKILRLSDKARGLIRVGVSSNPFLMNVVASLTAREHETLQEALGILAQAAGRLQKSNPSKEGSHAQNAQ